MASLLEGLKRHRVAVATVGAIEPVGAAYRPGVRAMVESATAEDNGRGLVAFGTKILRRIDRRVSIAVDGRRPRC